ncbi:translation initiation factor 2 [uncultured Desulfovibrio sp.]|uniref:translation initiation factor 2 n=1 Tax=uncultured Desulfovibrio sp. TaxID=167968 RepID=UPI00260CAECC|nr:translation initiation factor 2 [uncultured Desulfovibrio sp.]
MPHILLCFLLLLCPVLCALPSLPQAAPASAAPGRGFLLYAQRMEFYYQRPQAALLPDVLLKLDAVGMLADGEKRLVVAAFLAECLRRDAAARQALEPLIAPPDGRVQTPAVRRTLAWAVHLAGLDTAAEQVSSLLPRRADLTLHDQILASPSPLLRWDITSEVSVLHMYWGAFMAGGDTAYVDAVIAAACRYARLKAGGRQYEEDFDLCRQAAASLYEFTPRHPLVRRQVERAITATSNPAEQETLRLMLH